MTEPFNPSEHLTEIRGKGGTSQYLEVKFRLVWLREQHPDAVVSTELLEHRLGEVAVFRAIVTTPAGGSATGHGMETQRDFGDYLQKAETAAIGRALAALGYGTQFCEDMVIGHARGGQRRIADAPVDSRNEGRSMASTATGAATKNQIGFLERTIREHANRQDYDEVCRERCGKPCAELDRQHCSNLIDTIIAENGGEKEPPKPETTTNTGHGPDRSSKVTPKHLNSLHAQGNKTFSGDKDIHARIKGQAWVRFQRKSLNDLTQRECAMLLGYMEAGDILDETPIPA